jgi:N6-adenosine-specific RNA methylase IME4
MPLCFQAENVRHSQKPDKFYEMVEGFGKSRIDLFARQRRQGWDSWGDEIDGTSS